jgi:parallel beta-helix repeat protein
MSVENPIQPQLTAGGALPRTVMLSPGQALNGYLVHAQIGQAPHAFTYAGVDRHDDKGVVIRLARPDADSQEAVRREAEILTRLRHPGLMRLLGTASVAGLPYLVVAREDGLTLDRIIAAADGGLVQHAVQELVLRALDALEVVHGAGLVHCDLSPSNILIRSDGSPVLLDFETAQAPEDLDVVRSFVDATPGYAAPELYSLDGGIGPWTDFYSIAAIAYSLLTGRPAPDARERTEDRLFDDVPRELASPAFLAAIERALILSPEGRPLTVKAWRDAIAAAEAPAGSVTGAVSLAEIVRSALDQTIALPAGDEIPSTERVHIDELEAAAAHVPALTVRASDRSVTAPVSDTANAQRSGGGGRIFLSLVLVAGLVAAGWWGWEYYKWWTKTEWTVDAAGGGDGVTIGEVLETARAGSVIHIRPGVYRERLVLEKPVTLVGEVGGGRPVMIIPPQGSCLTSAMSQVAVLGLSFGGGDGSKPCIDLAAGAAELTDNVISGWRGTGLRLRDGSTAIVRKNRFSDIEGVGIQIESGSVVVVEENRIEGSAKAGISVRGGSNPTVTANRIEGSGQAGLVIAGGSAGGYADNVILGGKASGIEVRGGAEPIVVENRIGNAGEAGLYLYEGARGRFAGNRIVGSRLSGVIIAAGAEPVVEGNEIRANGEHGIFVFDGGSGALSQNVIKENKGYGIFLGLVSTTKVEDNIVEGNREPQVQQGQVGTEE